MRAVAGLGAELGPREGSRPGPIAVETWEGLNPAEGPAPPPTPEGTHHAPHEAAGEPEALRQLGAWLGCVTFQLTFQPGGDRLTRDLKHIHALVPNFRNRKPLRLRMTR